MSTDSPSLRADAQRNYNLLLSAAETVLSVQGASATLENIAKRAGVGIGTLYRHFPSRRALLEAVYADKIAALAGNVPSLLQTKSPDKALLAWLQMTVEYSATCGGFSDLMGLTAKDERSPIVSAGSHLLAAAQAAGLLRNDITIADLLRLVHGIVADASAEDLKRTNTLLSVIMSGLKQPKI